MPVLQPLYFAGGRYTAPTDRKLLTALIDPESNGNRIGGVVQPAGSMQVSITSAVNRTLSIDTGFCVIPDNNTLNEDSPGLHLCAIDSGTEALTLSVASGTRTDLIYASVDETYYTIINKAHELVGDDGVATLTTSAPHGFSVRQTVIVTGVDDFFDGSFVITAVTSDTFKYVRSGDRPADPLNAGLGNVISAYAEGYSTQPTPDQIRQVKIVNRLVLNNEVTLTTSVDPHGFQVGSLVKIVGVSSELDGVHQLINGTGTNVIKYNKVTPDQAALVTPISTSFVARARVPFAIKIASGTTTLPAGKNLKLASVLVTNTAITSVTDLRRFTTGLGGIHIFNSANIANVPAPSPVAGRITYDLNTRNLSVYDAATTSYRVIFNASTGHHDTVAVNASNDALHHTLGGGQFQAAPGNHNHSGAAVGNGFIGQYGPDTATAGVMGDFDIPANRTGMSPQGGSLAFTTPPSGRVLVHFSATLQTIVQGKVTALSLSISPGLAAGTSGDNFNGLRASGDNGSVSNRQSTTFVFEGAVSTAHTATINSLNTHTTVVRVTNPVIRVTPMP